MVDSGNQVPTRTVVIVAVLLGLGGAIPFFSATTFITDDHLLLAFSRYAPHPFVPFFRDQLGGESYRPVPMVLWWVLGRLAGPSTVPFAALAFLLHSTVAIEVGALTAAVGRDRRAALIAAALFFVAPTTREAAYWYSASMDLLATGFGIGAVLALLGGRTGLAILAFAAACLSKESAIVVPVLAGIALWAGRPELRWATIMRRVAVLLPVAALYLVIRTVVLRSVGGFGDAAAPLTGKLLQIAVGLVHAAGAGDVLGEPAAFFVGIAAWVGLLAGATRIARADVRTRVWSAPLAWTVVAVLPLLAAPWIVGARYFYLAAVGIAWLGAQLLRRTPPGITVGLIAALAGLSTAQAIARRSDVTAYTARLSAARRAVKAGLADGSTTFHIASGIKDLDLAVKEDPQVAAVESPLVVLGDVPASFVVMPASRAAELDFLVARPPIPPSGAYYGDRRIVGLARRGDDPTLDEVMQRLPAIRFIRLRLGPAGLIIHRDVTETLRNPDPD